MEAFLITGFIFWVAASFIYIQKDKSSWALTLTELSMVKGQNNSLNKKVAELETKLSKVDGKCAEMIHDQELLYNNQQLIREKQLASPQRVEIEFFERPQAFSKGPDLERHARENLHQ